MSDINTTTPYDPCSTNRRLKNLIGRRFFRLTVFAFWGRTKHNQATWLCRCICNCWTVVMGTKLLLKHTQSCGCWQQQRVQETKRKYPPSLTAAYRHFLQVRNRCTNPRNKRYADYGGRGIEFRFSSFEDWYAEVGPKPSAAHSIDRIDNDGHYEPGNLRWATMMEQNCNKRSNKLITHRGRSQLLKDWATELGINKITLHHRLYTYKWDVQRALTTPVRT